MTNSNVSARTIGFITLIATVLVIVSVFLTWYTISVTIDLGPLGTSTTSTDYGGLDLGDVGGDDWQKNIPIIALALGVVALILELLDIFMPKIMGKFASIIVTLLSVGIVVICAIYLTWDVFDKITIAGQVIETKVGMGGYLALAGGAIMLILGLVQMINSFGKKH